jgi:hypothetical protein
MWVIFALLDPDPVSESGYGSTDMIKSGSERQMLPVPTLEVWNLVKFLCSRRRICCLLSGRLCIWLPCYSFCVLGGGFVAFRAAVYSFCVLGGGFVAFRAAVYDGQYLATWSPLAKDDASFPQHLKRNEDLI